MNKHFSKEGTQRAREAQEKMPNVAHQRTAGPRMACPGEGMETGTCCSSQGADWQLLKGADPKPHVAQRAHWWLHPEKRTLHPQRPRVWTAAAAAAAAPGGDAHARLLLEETPLPAAGGGLTERRALLHTSAWAPGDRPREGAGTLHVGPEKPVERSSSSGAAEDRVEVWGDS